MTPHLVGLLILTTALAAANGSNDDSKGVATLAGAGVTRYRTAIAWGVVATLAGSLLSLAFAARISTVFTKGIVAVTPDPTFALAVLAGAVFWVGLATLTRLPVSTTHAIAGSMIGAGLLLAPGSIRWVSVATRVAIPLLASVALSYVISALLSRAVRGTPQRLHADGDAAAPAAAVSPGDARGSTGVVAAVAPARSSAPIIGVITSTSPRCRMGGPATRRIGLNVSTAHWLTSGCASFARGLNDTPKIWAIGAFGLVPNTLRPNQLLLVIAFAMAVGGAVAAVRVARRLGEHVVRMNHREGFTANLTTAFLVGLGANLGLPMSTTQVSAGAIAGVAGRQLRRLDTATLRDFVMAWTVTPAVAGLVALTVFAATRILIR